MDQYLKGKIISLSDEELLNLYERDYEDYRLEILENAKKEINKRGIEKKIWFYHDWFKQYGPFSRDEIIELIENKKIKKDYHVWREGLNDWVSMQSIRIYNSDAIMNQQTDSSYDGVRPPTFNPKLFNDDNKEAELYDYEGGRSGVKVAGILLIIMGVIWGVSSLYYAYLGTFYDDWEIFFVSGWNMVVSVAIVIIGSGLIKIKKWSYNWAI